jgi:hypothetical protein
MYSCLIATTLEPSRQSFKKPVIMKICPVGADLFHADERTRRTNSRFSQFCECV